MELSKALKCIFRSDEEKYKEKVNSYFTYKRILYRVKSIEKGNLIPLSLEEIRRLKEHLSRFEEHIRDEIDFNHYEKNYQLLVKQYVNCQRLKDKNIDRYLECLRELNSRIQQLFPFHEIGKAEAVFADDITLFWCPKCKILYYADEIRSLNSLDKERFYPLCPKCGRILEQTPIWIRRDGEGKIVLPLTFGIPGLSYNHKKHSWKNRRHLKCVKCKRGSIKIYTIEDPARYLERSYLYCNVCQKRYGLYLRNFKLSPPTSNIVRPIIAKTFSVLKYSPETINIVEKYLEGVEEVEAIIKREFVEEFLFTPNTQVKELIVGLVSGLPGGKQRIYKADKLGRSLNTNGLYIKLKEEYFNEAKHFLKAVYDEASRFYEIYVKNERLNIKHIVLHSLAHALIMKLPLYSGVSIDKFGYIYSVSDRSVLIYETADGGYGALYTITKGMEEESNEPLILMLLMHVKETIRSCTCDDRCKYCIAMKGCDELNNNLNRFTLAPLFNISADEVSWGF